MSKAATNYLELMFDALHNPLGVVILTNSPERLRQRLYKIRKDHAPTFDDIAFIISPTEADSQLWIIKKHHAPDSGNGTS